MEATGGESEPDSETARKGIFEQDAYPETNVEAEDERVIPDSHPSTPEEAVNLSQAAFEAHTMQEDVLPSLEIPAVSTSKDVMSMESKPDLDVPSAILPTSPTSSLSLLSELSCEDLPFDEWKDLIISYGGRRKSPEREGISSAQARANVPFGHKRRGSDGTSSLSGVASLSSKASSSKSGKKSADTGYFTGTSPHKRRSSRASFRSNPFQTAPRTVKPLSESKTPSRLAKNTKRARREMNQIKEEKREKPDRATTPIYMSAERSNQDDSDSSSSGVEVSSVSPSKNTVKSAIRWNGRINVKSPSQTTSGSNNHDEEEQQGEDDEDDNDEETIDRRNPLKSYQTHESRTRTRIKKATQGSDVTFRAQSREKTAKVERKQIKETYVALSTSTTGPKMSAAEIIAAMRARTMDKLGMRPEEDQKPLDAPMLIGKNDTVDKDAPKPEEDDDGELDDPSLLIVQSKEYKPNHSKNPIPAPGYLTRGSRRDGIKSDQTCENEKRLASDSKIAGKTVDRSRFSLYNLHRKKAAEENRGWFGIAGAARTEDNSLIQDGDEDAGKESDSDASLPDLDFSATRGSSTGAADKCGVTKRPRRTSDGALRRVAGALALGHEDVLEAVKFANEDLEQRDKESRQKEGDEERKFWVSDSKMLIAPYEPYGIEGRTRYDLALREGIVGESLASHLWELRLKGVLVKLGSWIPLRFL